MYRLNRMLYIYIYIFPKEQGGGSGFLAPNSYNIAELRTFSTCFFRIYLSEYLSTLEHIFLSQFFSQGRISGKWNICVINV